MLAIMSAWRIASNIPSVPSPSPNPPLSPRRYMYYEIWKEEEGEHIRELWGGTTHG